MATAEYVVCDDGTPLPALCDTATITVNVTAVNDAPTANNDSETTPEDTPKTFSVTANDTDVDGNIVPASVDLDPATAGTQTMYTAPGQGTFTTDGLGNVTFTPELDFIGMATAEYVVCDDGTPLPALCDTATITVNVSPVNDAPMVADTMITTPEDTPVLICVPISDVDHSSFSVTSFCTPAAGMVSGLTDPATTEYCLTYTPDANYTGPDTLCIEVCDGAGACDTSYVFLTVDPVNDAPTANNDSETTPEDTPKTFSVTANDTDVDGNIVPASVDLDPATAGTQTMYTAPGQGTFTTDGLGNVTFTPDLDFIGMATAEYVVCDDGTPLPALCDTATITVNVSPVNDAPMVADTMITTPEDTPVLICVPISDVDHSTFNVTSFCTPAAGMVSGLTDPATTEYCLTYTPDANYTGPDTLCIEVCDGAGACDTSYVFLTVDPVNDAPTANNDSETTPEDTPKTFSVTANDTDVDGNIVPASVDLDPATAGTQTMYTAPGQGTFTTDGLGNVTFTPDLDFIGMATAEYVVCDDGTPLPALCDTATITVNVSPVNDAPMVADTMITTPEDTPVLICVPISDVDHSSFSVTSFCAPAAGMVSGLTDPATTEYRLTYTPDANYTGPDTLCIEVCDGAGACDTSYVFLTVDPVNDAPTANNDSETTPEDTPKTFSVTANDTDVDGNIVPASVDLDPATAGTQTMYTAPGQGTFTTDGLGNVTFTPEPDFIGMATAEYVVCDDGTPLPALCDTATITVNVSPVNDAPMVADTMITTPEDTPVLICVPISDVDHSTFNVTSFCAPAAGMVSGLTDPATTEYCLTYTPDANYTGPDTLCIEVCDGAGACDTSYVFLTVDPVNDAPTANNDSETTPEDTPKTFSVTANDTDVDGNIVPASVDLDPATAGTQTMYTAPGQGTFTTDGLGNVTFTPDLDFIGMATAEYVVCDDGTPLPAQCDTATISVNVTATSVRLLARVLLTGGLFDSPDTLMIDSLRVRGYIPLTEPYTAIATFTHVNSGGSEMVTDSATVFAASGSNSIVDWVFLELRSALDSAQVVSTRSALVQRDGDVVDIDGVSPVVFENTFPASYFVSVRHRNHLGAMTEQEIALTNVGTVLDFTNLATALWNDNPNLNGYEQNTLYGKFALWPCNVNADTATVFAGQFNDKDPIFNEVDSAPGNSLLHSQSYNFFGYHQGDVNLDGRAIFAGQKMTWTTSLIR
ncbi:MAG: tandem-95 repeat protein [Lewinellaceae bacterium]|nr:tandem-95 repeat protein [Lewinellaceae bacterium]